MKVKKLINLTPHPVTIRREGVAVTIPPSGEVARVEETRVPIGTLEVEGLEVPLNRRAFGKPTGLPEPEEGVYLIVASLVAQACLPSFRMPGRSDLLSPDLLVRDEEGRIVGCEGFAVPS